MKNKAVRLNRREQASGMLAALIPLIGFALFSLIPLILSAVISFTELHSTDLKEMEFVGFENYKTILTNADDGRTYASYLSTVVYALNAPICIALALWIAYMINKSRIGKRFFRSVFFIPYVCSTVVISLTFRNMLYRLEGGVLNDLLVNLGFEPVRWLVDMENPMIFMISAVVMTVWSGLGWCIVLFQAALANVDQSYYEAARIDGASEAQMFWKITWPAISPTTAYLFTMKLIWAFQSMAEMHILAENSGGAPTWGDSGAWVSDTVVKHIYNMIFHSSHQFGYGLAAAAGWILAIIILIITRINLRAQKRWVNYDF